MFQRRKILLLHLRSGKWRNFGPISQLTRLSFCPTHFVIFNQSSRERLGRISNYIVDDMVKAINIIVHL